MWFPDIGWQAFDPTAEVPLSGEYDDSLLARLGRIVERLAPVLIAIAVVALVRGPGWSFVGRGGGGTRRGRPASTAGWSARAETRGRPRRPDETPRQYADALSSSVLPHPEELELVARVVTTAAYVPDEPGPEDRAGAEAALAGALQATPRRRS